MPPWVSAVITPSPIEARVIWARSRSASRAFSTSWRCISCCRVRRNARRMSTLAVVRLATSSSLSKAREPSPRASLKALAAGVTFSLIAWISVFHCCTCSALACPVPMPARILPATSISSMTYLSPTSHSSMARSK